jgi:alcohol dehydrogenase
MMTPPKMFAVRQIGVGGLDQLESAEVPVPRPGRGEVLVRVGACGLNNSDILRRPGGHGSENDPASVTSWKRESPELPRILGSDVAGNIVEVGEEVSPARCHERVLVNPTLYNHDPEDPTDVDYLGSERDGRYAQYCVVPAANAHRINSEMSFEDLATFPIAYLTALHMLRRARVERDETVVVTGASGGVGSAVLQWGTLASARMIAIIGDGKESVAISLSAGNRWARRGARSTNPVPETS